jgi:hypothetical protein
MSIMNGLTDRRIGGRNFDVIGSVYRGTVEWESVHPVSRGTVLRRWQPSRLIEFLADSGCSPSVRSEQFCSDTTECASILQRRLLHLNPKRLVNKLLRAL